MKFVLILALCLPLSLMAMAKEGDSTNGGHPDDVDSTFGGGTREFEFERFDDDSILMAINHDAQFACTRDGLCRLSSVTSNDNRFTIQFNAGIGSQLGQMGNSGTNIIIPSQGGTFGQNEPYVGLTVRYTRGKCTQTVNVPRSVYYALNRYMYGLLTEEGGTRRGFTPADEAMIMFYTTVMKQASGCVAAQ